jgi:hypothetical protein
VLNKTTIVCIAHHLSFAKESCLENKYQEEFVYSAFVLPLVWSVCSIKSILHAVFVFILNIKATEQQASQLTESNPTLIPAEQNQDHCTNTTLTRMNKKEVHPHAQYTSQYY